MSFSPCPALPWVNAVLARALHADEASGASPPFSRAFLYAAVGNGQQRQPPALLRTRDRYKNSKSPPRQLCRGFILVQPCQCSDSCLRRVPQRYPVPTVTKNKSFTAIEYCRTDPRYLHSSIAYYWQIVAIFSSSRKKLLSY
jgi:hypothetical protein